MRPANTPRNRLLSIDELDRGIVNLSAKINSATYELLILLRQFDERAGWLQWTFTNCVDWLHWRCDLSLSAAREKVRVAHALKALPLIAAAFSRGELSYSKVRALTRVARVDNEDGLVAFARKTTASRVEERCRELRCGTVASVNEAHRAHANRSLRIHRDHDRGMMTITIELPLETGELLEKALDRARDDAPSLTPEGVNESWSAIQADALIAVANTYLSGGGEPSTGASDNYQVTIHVDRSALANGDGRSSLPIESAKANLSGIGDVHAAANRLQERPELVAWLPYVRDMQIEQIAVHKVRLERARAALETLHDYAREIRATN